MWRRFSRTPCSTSFTRVGFVTIALLLLSSQPGFTLRWIWYISVAGSFFQLTMNVALLRREFRLRLPPEPLPATY